MIGQSRPKKPICHSCFVEACEIENTWVCPICAQSHNVLANTGEWQSISLKQLDDNLVFLTNLKEIKNGKS